MIRYLILFIGIILCSAGAYSQNNLAVLKYEEAEAAFNKTDYAKALQLIEEVEQIAGVTSGTLYLKITAKDRLLTASPHSELGESDRKLLADLRTHTKQYLDAMQEQDLDDNFRTVYGISNRLKEYPDIAGGGDVLAILERFYQALGGRERIHNVQSIIKKFETTTVAMETELTTHYVQKYAVGKSRMEIRGEGYTVRSVYNKPLGIAYIETDIVGTEEVMKTDLEEVEGLERTTRDSEALVFGELIQSEKYTDAVVDESDWEGQPVYVVQGDQQVAVFSKDNGFLLSIVEESIPGTKMTMFFKDYRSVDGIQFPFTVEAIAEVSEITSVGKSVYSEILLNPTISDTEFQ